MSDYQQPDTPQHDAGDNAHLNDELHHTSEERFRRQMREAAHLLTQGDGRAALPLLRWCFERHPEDVNVLVNLGGAYILAEQHRYAVPILEKAAELAPNDPAVWSNLAAAHLGKLVTATRARQERALEAYRRVTELEPDYPNVHYNMGLIHVDRRDWDAAHAAFARAIESNPSDQDARLMHRRVEEIRNRPPDVTNN